jgi:hypothetical protein
MNEEKPHYLKLSIVSLLSGLASAIIYLLSLWILDVSITPPATSPDPLGFKTAWVPRPDQVGMGVLIGVVIFVLITLVISKRFSHQLNSLVVYFLIQTYLFYAMFATVLLSLYSGLHTMLASQSNLFITHLISYPIHILTTWALTCVAAAIALRGQRISWIGKKTGVPTFATLVLCILVFYGASHFISAK